MVDIIITLPRNLILAILMGKKSVECRKTFPKIGFQYRRVWFVEKGTSYVRGCFTIDHVSEHHDYFKLWHEYGREIFVDEQWFNDYAKTAKKALYLWHIAKVFKCEDKIDVREYFGVRHNPQSFIYRPLRTNVKTNLVHVYKPRTKN